MKLSVRTFLWHLLPRSTAVNWVFALPYFLKNRHRLPRHPRSSQATFEDYVFYHMIRPWTAFHESCVDKETAKIVARYLAPNLKTASTVATLSIGPETTLADVAKTLFPFLGKAFVAKPTQGSGSIFF